jgi:DNA-binding NarL/FixJ family response regulator
VSEPAVERFERRLRVLLADDHPPTRDDVRRSLQRDGRFVVCAEAADAAQAVQAALREQPDMCVLDIRMPGSGTAAAWEIAARVPTARIVMLTVSEDDSDLFAALRAGAHGYLVKDINLRRLPQALYDVCHGEAAIPRTLVARMVERFHGSEPRFRRLAAAEVLGGRLTSREWEILELLADGLSTREIARRLALAPSGVRAHIAGLVRKLGVDGRDEAIGLFRRRSGT